MSLRKSIKAILPEAIPMPAAYFYSAIPANLLKEPQSQLAGNISEAIKSGTLVDLGSGPGHLAIEIAKRAPELKVYGIDLSGAMVKIARKNVHDISNVQFKLSNATELPFEDNSVDFIVSTGSLHHWREPVRIFNECYRVLKDGGEAWIYDGCSHIPGEEAGKVREKYGFWRYRFLSAAVKFHGFTVEEYHSKVKNILEQTKFKDSYIMEQADIWMKIAARKNRVS